MEGDETMKDDDMETEKPAGGGWGDEAAESTDTDSTDADTDDTDGDDAESDSDSQDAG
ncbi:MAG: hypothetical protein WD689_07670 [Gaiellaceae bacterium]